jgi:UDP-N-acetylmuramate--alanine ligase
VGEVSLRLGGRHNLLNALGASAAARALGADWSAIFAALADFRGVGRRFQRVGEVEDVLVIDDYAHHPTEVAAAIQAARTIHAGRRLVAVFQPHLFSRTRDFARGFGESLAVADAVVVTDVFPAREDPIPGITGRTIFDAVKSAGGRDVMYVEALSDVVGALRERLREGDVVLTLGAGSIETVGPELIASLKEAVHA